MLTFFRGGENGLATGCMSFGDKLSQLVSIVTQYCKKSLRSNFSSSLLTDDFCVTQETKRNRDKRLYHFISVAEVSPRDV